MLCRETAGALDVMMLIGRYWGQRSGTRITLGYVDLSLNWGHSADWSILQRVN